MGSNRLGLIVFSCVILLIGAIFLIFGESPAVKPVALIPQSPETSRSKRVDPDERPYLNTELNVNYVGDQACENCHFQDTESFGMHPMGRSMAKMGDLKLPPLEKPFDIGNYRYSIEKTDGKVFHVETRLNNAGEPVSSQREEINLIMGSGTRGYAFLSQKQDKVIQSPIAWFTEAHKYDIAPGYAGNNQHFSREIQRECFFCHTNRAEILPSQEIKFHGLAIGCERCHGPGELHLNHQEQIDGYDKTIVNPAKLTPSRRDQVCYQCHLNIEARRESILNPLTDYRPGLDLEKYVTRTDENSPDPLAKFRSVSHVQQMEESVCFQKSDGKMGCITCHNPHDWAKPEVQRSKYLKTCLDCHSTNEPCGLTETERRKDFPSQNCLSCHMPKQDVTDIAHTVLTDHRIQRNPKHLQDQTKPAETSPDKTENINQPANSDQNK